MSRRKIPSEAENLLLFDSPSVQAAVSDSTPTDQDERELALDTTHSWLIEAPAGSGKTGLLIQRFLKLLGRPEVELPEQVLAVTFTLKAAGEIRDRVLEQLVRARMLKEDDIEDRFARQTYRLAKEVLERDRRMDWHLLDNPRRLNLRTIDSVCAEITRGLPMLSGGSSLVPVEDATSLHRLAAERTLLQLGGTDRALSDSLSLILLHRDGDLLRCRDLLAEMLALRDQWGRLIPLGRGTLDDQFLDTVILPRIEETLKIAIGTELRQIEQSFPSTQLEQLSSLACAIARCESLHEKGGVIGSFADDCSPPEATADDLARWKAVAHLLLTKTKQWRRRVIAKDLGIAVTNDHCAVLREIIAVLNENEDLRAHLQRVQTIPPATYPSEQWRVAKALFRVLYRSLAELQIVFAERGECDFTELGLLARAGLRSSVEVVERVGWGDLKHLLVDEMQDTSTSQYELISLLTQMWDGRSQTVFLVGDPKQSIYLFRQARVERFLYSMKESRIGDIGLGVLRLRSNFRSQRGMVASFNSMFAQVFASAETESTEHRVPYIAANAVRADSIGSQNTVWHPQVITADSADPAEEAGRLSEMEAREVRQIIDDWRSKPLPKGRAKPWTIAVLVRNRNHLTQIVKELKCDYGKGSVPFRAVNIDPLGERPEILDLFSLTRALLHPADRIAWLSILRAPWCGIELADLHLLCGQDDPQWQTYTLEELIELRGALLSPDAQNRLKKICSIVQAATENRFRISFSELIERTWRSLGGDSYLSPEEGINAEQYFRLLDDLIKQGGTLDLNSLKQRLGRLYADPGSKADAVDLMTIHGAKGLEWDVVLVPGMARRSHSDSQRLLVWDEINIHENDASQVLLAPITGKGDDSEALNIWLRGIHKRREEAECRRLFYVACTRAREELHLFATLKMRQDGVLKPHVGTLLDAAWPAAQEFFVNYRAGAKPLIAPVISIRESFTESVLPGIAAGNHSHRRSPALHRLPIEFKRFPNEINLARRRSGIGGSPLFERPEGSFASRGFGNALHTLLEVMAKRLDKGQTVSELLTELPTWKDRIKAILRNSGLAPTVCEQFTPELVSALRATLLDRHGVWILSSRLDSASERAFTSWDETRSEVRVDRIFRAGEAPLQEGGNCIWIVDFKSGQFRENASKFEDQERAKYGPQLETYAHLIRRIAKDHKIRLGLYYPVLSKLVWWAVE